MKIKHLLGYPATAAVALAIGAASQSAPTSTPDATPTVTRTVEVTPPACADALSDADRLFTVAGQGFDVIGQGLTEAAAGNLAGLDSATARLTVLTRQMEPLTGPYKTARASCLGE